MRALEKSPKNRFESAKAMKKALEHYLDTFKNEDVTTEKEKNRSSSHTSLPNIKYSHTTHEEIVRTPACIERVPENPTLLRPVAITSANHSNLASSIQKMSNYTGNVAISQSHMMKPKPLPVPNKQNEAIQLETTKLRSGTHLGDDEPTQLDRKVNSTKSSEENLNSNQRIIGASSKPLSKETKRYSPAPKESIKQESTYRGAIKPGPVPKDSSRESIKQESTYRGAIKPGPVPKDSIKPGPVPRELLKPGPVPKKSINLEPVPKESTATNILSDEVPTVVSNDPIKFNASSSSNAGPLNSEDKFAKKQDLKADPFGYLINKKPEKNDSVTLFDLVLWGTVLIGLIIWLVSILIG